MEGLDLVEHGGNAYPDFGVSTPSKAGFSGGSGFLAAADETIGQLEPIEQTS
jgi:hypothetical protein